MGYSCCDFTDDLFAELHRVGAITGAEYNDENACGNASLQAEIALKGIARLVAAREAAAKDSTVQPALDEPRIVVFAGGGVVRAVATQGMAAPPVCVVVDYDDCSDTTEAGIRAFEQERIGQDCAGFDTSGAKYIY